MKKLKKYSLLICLMFSIFVLTSCGNVDEKASEIYENEEMMLNTIVSNMKHYKRHSYRTNDVKSVDYEINTLTGAIEVWEFWKSDVDTECHFEYEMNVESGNAKLVYMDSKNKEVETLVENSESGEFSITPNSQNGIIYLVTMPDTKVEFTLTSSSGMYVE